MAKTPKEAIQEFLEEEKNVSILHPEEDEEKLFYRRYRIAFYTRPDNMLRCHLCQKDDPRRPPAYIRSTVMSIHNKRKHKRAVVECDNDTCTVMFCSIEEKEKHQLYAHVKPYGYWIPTK